MDWQHFIKRIWLLVSHPADTWTRLARRLEKSPEEAFENDRSFFLKNLLVVAIAALIDTLFNYENPRLIVSLLKAIITAVTFYSTLILCIPIIRYILNKMGEGVPQTNFIRRFVIYSIALNMVIHAILSVFSQLFFLYIAILYTFYIVWEGVTPMLGVSDQKRTTISVCICATITLIPVFILLIFEHLFPIVV